METSTKEPRLLDQVSTRLRYLHYARKTEQAYRIWIRRFILFHNKRHPREMGTDEVVAFLNYLATKKQVSASTQNQALNAIVFLYKQVLNMELGDLHKLQYAKRPKKLPVVLTHAEVMHVMEYLREPHWTMVALMYGSGLRFSECITLRVMDVDFSRKELFVRAGKGGKDRVTMLPEKALPGLKAQIEQVKQYHEQDVKKGINHVSMPYALKKKFPNAGKELKWQFIFASKNLSREPGTGNIGRHHIHEKSAQRMIRNAIKRAGILKYATCHSFRHSFSTNLLENGYDIRTVQELLGHKHVNTTMIYTHVLNRGGKGVKSPMDNP